LARCGEGFFEDVENKIKKAMGLFIFALVGQYCLRRVAGCPASLSAYGSLGPEWRRGPAGGAGARDLAGG